MPHDDETIDDVFHAYPAAAFEVGGLKYAFPVTEITEIGGNRIIPRERPYRDGAKLDDTGSRPKGWTMTALFNNDVAFGEPGLVDVNGGVALYPDVLNFLILAFDVHETGTLTVPTIGEQPARAESYQRVEVFSERSLATVQFTFLEDNEDAVDFRIITTPTVDANAQRLAQTTTFDAQSAGNWDQFMADLETSVNALEDLSNSPQNTSAQIKQQSRVVRDVAKKVVQISSRPGVPGRNLFGGPRGNRTERKIVQQQGITARAANDARRGRPNVTTFVVRRNTSLFAVATIAQQDFGELLAINPDIDPLFIPSGSSVNVYANTGSVR